MYAFDNTAYLEFRTFFSRTVHMNAEQSHSWRRKEVSSSLWGSFNPFPARYDIQFHLQLEILQAYIYLWTLFWITLFKKNFTVLNILYYSNPYNIMIVVYYWKHYSQLTEQIILKLKKKWVLTTSQNIFIAMVPA